jgi:hypothetical protein
MNCRFLNALALTDPLIGSGCCQSRSYVNPDDSGSESLGIHTFEGGVFRHEDDENADCGPSSLRDSLIALTTHKSVNLQANLVASLPARILILSGGGPKGAYCVGKAWLRNCE